MGGASIAIAIAALISGVLPHPGMYLAMTGSLLAAGLGLAAWRRRESSGAVRLAGAGGLAISILALLLTFARYTLTLAAVARMTALVG